MAQRKPDAKRTVPITPAWTRAEACELAVAVEAVCAPMKCHVALTGGCLYKPGPRKDADLIIYRASDLKELDFEKMFEALESVGVTRVSWAAGRRVAKAKYQGKSVDLMFPQYDGEYEPEVKSTLSTDDLDWLNDL